MPLYGRDHIPNATYQVHWPFVPENKISKVFCLFDLVLYVLSTIFQLYRDGSSWVEPVLS